VQRPSAEDGPGADVDSDWPQSAMDGQLAHHQRGRFRQLAAEFAIVDQFVFDHRPENPFVLAAALGQRELLFGTTGREGETQFNVTSFLPI